MLQVQLQILTKWFTSKLHEESYKIKRFIKVSPVFHWLDYSLCLFSAAVSPPRGIKRQHYRFYDETETAETLVKVHNLRGLEETFRRPLNALLVLTCFSLVSSHVRNKVTLKQGRNRLADFLSL